MSDAARLEGVVEKLLAANAKLLKELGAAKAQPIEFDELTVYTSDPPIYVFRRGDRSMAVSALELQTRATFQRRYAESFGAFPQVPAKASEWLDVVNSWLEAATRQEQPPEASQRAFEAGCIEDLIAGLAQGESAADLAIGARVVHPEHGDLICSRPILRAARADLPALTSSGLCVVLRELGWSPRVVRIGEVAVRVWARGVEAPADESAT